MTEWCQFSITEQTSYFWSAGQMAKCLPCQANQLFLAAKQTTKFSTAEQTCNFLAAEQNAQFTLAEQTSYFWM